MESFTEPDEEFFGKDIPLGEYDKDAKSQKKIRQGRSTKKKVDHSSRTIAYWEKQGYRIDKLESWQNVNGAWLRKDFIGSIDYLVTKPGEIPVLVQVCAKGDVRAHLRKMLGDTEIKGGETRRHAIDYFRSTLGWWVAIQWFDQPSGHGGKWETGLEYVTDEVVADIDSGRRLKRIA